MLTTLNASTQMFATLIFFSLAYEVNLQVFCLGRFLIILAKHNYFKQLLLAVNKLA